jgi:hypothetical protein
MTRTTALVTLLAVTWVAPVDAARVVAPASKKAKLKYVSIVTATDGKQSTLTMGLTVDSRAPGWAVLLPLPKGWTARVVGKEADIALQRIDHFSSPRLEEMTPHDPCIDPNPPKGMPVTNRAWRRTPAGDKVSWPKPSRRTRAAATLEVVNLSDLREAITQRKLAFDVAVVGQLTRIAGHSGRVALVSPSKRSPRRTTHLQQVQLSGPGSATLPLNTLALDAPVGRLLDADLWFLTGDAQPGVGIEDPTPLPTEVPFPEVAFEDPVDLRSAVRARRFTNGMVTGGLLLEHASPVNDCDPCVTEHLTDATLSAFGASGKFITRYRASVGRRTTKPLKVSLTRNRRIVQTRWIFRRPWRKPIKCEFAWRYMNIIKGQQLAQIRQMSTLTGIGVRELQQLSAARGYSLRPDGTLGPAPRTP